MKVIYKLGYNFRQFEFKKKNNFALLICPMSMTGSFNKNIFSSTIKNQCTDYYTTDINYLLDNQHLIQVIIEYNRYIEKFKSKLL